MSHSFFTSSKEHNIYVCHNTSMWNFIIVEVLEVQLKTKMGKKPAERPYTMWHYAVDPLNVIAVTEPPGNLPYITIGPPDLRTPEDTMSYT
jgi:hypothetical protein